jgi:hypothetical protein
VPTIQVRWEFVCYTHSLFPTPALCCVFAETLAKVRRNAFLHDAAEKARQRRRDGDQQPEESRKDEACDRNGFKRNGDTVGLVETKVHGEDVGDEFDPVDDEGGEKEGGDREGTDADEKDINGAGDALAAAAVATVGEMLVVVGAHGRGEARYVVTPSGEDVSYHLVNAGTLIGPTVRGKS